MYKRLYPKNMYPQGHPDLAGCLDDLARLLGEQRNYGGARGYSSAPGDETVPTQRPGIPRGILN